MCKDSFHTVTERFFGMLGLAKRAGKTVLGTDMICEKMRAKKKPVLVLASREASEATRARLQQKCNFYNIPYCEVDVSTEKLGSICGCSGLAAAVAVTDAGFAEQLLLECK
jgi:ribosomal protein L7Ae-like RNA K-turn-binding protein